MGGAWLNLAGAQHWERQYLQPSLQEVGPGTVGNYDAICHLPSAPSRPALELATTPTNRLRTGKFHKKGFIAKFQKRRFISRGHRMPPPQGEAERWPKHGNRPTCPATPTEEEIEAQFLAVDDLAQVQPVLAADGGGCSLREDDRGSCDGHLITFLLLYRRDGRKAYCGIGA